MSAESSESSESFVSAEQAPAGIEAVDALLQPFNRSDAPGLVVGVARHGKTLYRRGYGLASIEHGVANTPRTRMRIGSTSKHFACLAALLLAEQGLLSIDDAVRRYLPELPALGGDGPTLRQLMNHTGGWRCHIDLSFLAHGAAIQPKGAALALLARQSELNFASGSRMLYSNGGYHLLSQVIARIGGQTYEQFLARHILEPLGMADTESLPSDLDIHPGVATLYLPRPEGGWRRGLFPSEELRGEGGIVSTLDDMLRWLAHLRGGDKRIGGAASWARMCATTLLPGGTDTCYGLGLMRRRYRGVEVIHHAGGVVGGAAQMLSVPAHGLDIVLMTNGAPVAPVALSFKIVDALLGEALPEPPEERLPAAAYPALLGRRYHASASGLVVGFIEVADRLGMSFLNSAPLPMRPGESGPWLGLEDLAINPVVIDLSSLQGDAALATLTLSEGGRPEVFARLPERPPSMAELAPQLIGDYRVPDLAASARIELNGAGDELLLRILGEGGRHALRLTPLSTEVLAWTSTDPLLAPVRGVLNVERAEGRVVGLRLDTVRTRHLRLMRAESAA